MPLAGGILTQGQGRKKKELREKSPPTLGILKTMISGGGAQYRKIKEFRIWNFIVHSQLIQLRGVKKMKKNTISSIGI